MSLEKISNWGGRPSKEPFDRSYYHEERYLSAYSQDDFQIFAEHIPDDLLSELGYSLKKSSEKSGRHHQTNSLKLNSRD